LVNVSDKLELLPTCTVPNARLVGFADSVPGITPVPESGILSVEFDAFETMLSAPLAAPALPGAKTAVKLRLWLTARVAGRERPLIENPAPLVVACVMVTALPPVFVKVSDSRLLLPTSTVPKLKVEGLGVSVPATAPAPTPERFSTTLLLV
jgi:hypothetical protein